MMMGVVLILSALLLFLYNGYEERRAGQQAEMLLDDVQSAIEKETDSAAKTDSMETDSAVSQEAEQTDDISSVIAEEADSAAKVNEMEADFTDSRETLPAEMPVVQIDAYEYIGYLSIPDLNLKLPVMAEWDYNRLKIAPCCQFGSSRTNDLVIAAHNYKTHFGSLSSLETGAEVIFTDMDGIKNRYALMKKPQTLAPDDVNAVQNSGYDLVLYTCTPGGATRVAVFCDRVQKDR